MKKVCDKLGLRFGRCKEDAMAVLAEKVVMNPTQQQLKNTLDVIEEERHAILFIDKVDKYKYRKLLEQMANEMLQKKKDPFPKTIAEACDILAGWKNQYRGRDNHINNANEGIALATTGSEEDKSNSKKKEISVTNATKQDTMQMNVMEKQQ